MGKMSTLRIFTGLTAAASDRSGLRTTVDAAIEATNKVPPRQVAHGHSRPPQ